MQSLSFQSLSLLFNFCIYILLYKMETEVQCPYIQFSPTIEYLGASLFARWWGYQEKFFTLKHPVCIEDQCANDCSNVIANLNGSVCSVH